MKFIKKYIKALKDDLEKGMGEMGQYLFVIALLVAIFILFLSGFIF